MNNHYETFVTHRLENGDDPNTITKGIEEALMLVGKDWALFGDGRWRQDTCCSVCGSWAAGVCGHGDVPGRAVILRSEYERRSAIPLTPEPTKEEAR